MRRRGLDKTSPAFKRNFDQSNRRTSNYFIGGAAGYQKLHHTGIIRRKRRGIKPRDPSTGSGSVRLNDFASQNRSLTDLILIAAIAFAGSLFAPSQAQTLQKKEIKVYANIYENTRGADTNIIKDKPVGDTKAPMKLSLIHI